MASHTISISAAHAVLSDLRVAQNEMELAQARHEELRRLQDHGISSDGTVTFCESCLLYRQACKRYAVALRQWSEFLAPHEPGVENESECAP